MGTIHIVIGEARTLSVDGWKIIPDDRQQQVEIIGGVAVQDFGRANEGDKISCTVQMLATDFKIICGYWDSRERVTITDEAGKVWENMRVVVKSYEYVPSFAKAYDVALEFWRV